MTWHSANICKECWYKRHGDRLPVRAMSDTELEKCCFCGKMNDDAIYVRQNAQVLGCQHAQE